MEVDIDLDDSDVQLPFADLSSSDDANEDSDTSPQFKTPMENLKICIDNEGDPDPSVTFLKIETEDGQLMSDASAKDGSNGPTVTLKLSSCHKKNATYKENKKVYENELGSFEAGLDTTSEEAKSKRIERAKRFGEVGEDEQVNEKKMDIEALYKSLGVSELDLSNVGERRIRRDTIMLRGVNNLSTNDIFFYFRKYPPSSLEWIDDSSCNVIFSSVNDANRALINTSDPIRCGATARKAKTSVISCTGVNKPAAKKDGAGDGKKKALSDADDTIDLMTDDIESEEAVTLHMDVGHTEVASDENVDSDPGVFMEEDEVPPGKWRVSTDSSQPRLFMRFATKADIKTKGAEGNSEYYRRHGNPNYGGMPGLISKSKKQRYRRDQDRLLEKEARDTVSSGGRSKVTYDTDDLFGETYEEPESEQMGAPTSSRLRAAAGEGSGVRNVRKRDHDSVGEGSGVRNVRKRDHDSVELEADIHDELDELMENSGIVKRKRMPMKMAADEEEEKLNIKRTQASALFAEIDVRKQIKKKMQLRQSSLNTFSDYVLERKTSSLDKSPSPPKNVDLRSRLSRRNDW